MRNENDPIQISFYLEWLYTVLYTAHTITASYPHAPLVSERRDGFFFHFSRFNRKYNSYFEIILTIATVIWINLNKNKIFWTAWRR